MKYQLLGIVAEGTIDYPSSNVKSLPKRAKIVDATTRIAGCACVRASKNKLIRSHSRCQWNFSLTLLAFLSLILRFFDSVEWLIFDARALACVYAIRISAFECFNQKKTKQINRRNTLDINLFGKITRIGIDPEGLLD